MPKKKLSTTIITLHDKEKCYRTTYEGEADLSSIHNVCMILPWIQKVQAQKYLMLNKKFSLPSVISDHTCIGPTSQ